MLFTGQSKVALLCKVMDTFHNCGLSLIVIVELALQFLLPVHSKLGITEVIAYTSWKGTQNRQWVGKHASHI